MVTTKEMYEYAKCAIDPVYFINNYVKILDMDKGEISFNLRPYQEKMINSFNTHHKTIVNGSRVSGKSCVSMAYCLHSLLFKENQNIALVCNKRRNAEILLQSLKRMHQSLPMFMQQGVVEWNKCNIKFENNSKIVACSGADTIRGFTFTTIVLDEFAFVPNFIQKEILEVITKQPKIIITSTPNGTDNEFYRLWLESLFLNTYYPIYVTWVKMKNGKELL